MKQTRKRILEAMYEALSRQGFQRLRTDEVVKELGITKGAFYHYFPDKVTLGYAVIDEVMAPRILEFWNGLQNTDVPLEFMLDLCHKLRHNEPHPLQESPLSSLIMEMSEADEGFRLRLHNILELIQQTIATVFQQAQEQGNVKSNFTPGQLARFIIAQLEGCGVLNRAAPDNHSRDGCLEALEAFLMQQKS